MADLEELRIAFLDLLTCDSETTDARRRDYNQAIFNRELGYAIWTYTDLDMVMEKFDKAARAYEEADRG